MPTILIAISLWLMGFAQLFRTFGTNSLTPEKTKSERRVALMMIIGGSGVFFIPWILKYLRLD